MTCMNQLPALPLGTSDFKTLRFQQKIYVDKTALVYQLASRSEKFFLTRPRRFGKSLLVSTFASLFRDGLKDFTGLAIEKLWQDKTYTVIKLDFSTVKDFNNLAEFKEFLRSSLVRAFARCGFAYDRSLESEWLYQIADWLESQPKGSLVLLIDEYDAPLTACLGDKALFEDVARALASFYAIVKSCDGCWRFVFVTGITKVYPTGIFSSEFNQYTDISLDPLFAPLAGFTEEDVEQYFSEHIEEAAKALNLPREALRRQLRENYAGYCFDENVSTHLYAPWSVLNFLSWPEEGFEPYWVQSGGHISNLLRYLQPHSLKEPENYASNTYAFIDELACSSTYDDLRDVVLLTQAGYLTIKHRNHEVFYIGYPNKEVTVSMAEFYTDMLLHNRSFNSFGAGKLGDAVCAGNVALLFDQANHAFAGIDRQQHPVSSEKVCLAFLQIFLAGLGFCIVPEQHSPLGRSELEIDAPKVHWVLGLKYQSKDESEEALLAKAVEQITEKQCEVASEKLLIRVAAVFSEEKRSFVRWQQVNSTGAS